MTAVEAERLFSPDASPANSRPLEPDPTAVTRCSVRPAPEREPWFDDEPRARHLHLIQAVATPQLPFPQPVSARASTPFPSPGQPESVRRLTVVPDFCESAGAGPASSVAPPLVAAVAPPFAPAAGPIAAPTAAPTAAAALRSPVRSPSRLTSPAPGTQHRPDPSRFSRQFAQGVIEVLSGRRPMGQLTRHVSPAVQRGLTRAGGNHPLESRQTPTLHSLHLSEPAAGVCEMSAIVVVGVRYRALAARLEWTIDHWRCTALQIG